MWKDYSAGYIRNNRSSGITIRVASLVAAFFLAFPGSIFYSVWMDEIEGIVKEEGDWQARITGNLSTEEEASIAYFANVERVTVNEELSAGEETVVDLCFHRKRTIVRDMAQILSALELPESAASYHLQLLSLYFVRIPGDTAPRLLMPAYLAAVLLVCFSMILLIHSAFRVSMGARIHQLGILSGIGAAPAQIRICLMQEAAILAMPSILTGVPLGVALAYLTVRAVNRIAAGVRSREAVFRCHPLLLLAILLASVFTVFWSAFLPAWRLSRLSPLEAIRGADDPGLRRKGRFPILSRLCGMEGELAGNALRAQRKALWTASVSLTLSFLGFMLTWCFFTLSGISTEKTYFQRYQDAWDVMITVKNTELKDLAATEELRELPGVRDCVAYQKAEAVNLIPEGGQSEELRALGGLQALTGMPPDVGDFSGYGAEDGSEEAVEEAPAVSDAQAASGSLPGAPAAFYPVKVEVIIMDDAGFLNFCAQAGISPGLDGTVVRNRLWDSLHSNFRYPAWIPFVKEGTDTLLWTDRAGQTPTEIPVLAYTTQEPLLREEYEDYALVHFMPLSLWKQVEERVNGAGEETYIRLLASERTDPEKLDGLQQRAQELFGGYEVSAENRIREKQTNDEIIGAYKLLLSCFCTLLALIGLAGVFTNTMGFVRQRKREFARYMSVGLTPQGVRRIFCIEACCVVGRPLIITSLLSAALIRLMLAASFLDPAEFIREAPFAPVLLFILAVAGLVSLAYYLGGRRLMRHTLAEALRDDTLM